MTARFTFLRRLALGRGILFFVAFVVSGFVRGRGFPIAVAKHQRGEAVIGAYFVDDFVFDRAGVGLFVHHS